MSSSSWRSLGPALSVEPGGLEGRAALLELVEVVTPATSQGKVLVKYKLCDKTFAGITMRMVAGVAKKPHCYVAKCTKATADATPLGKRYMADLDDKREKNKRVAESAMLKSRQTFSSPKGRPHGRSATGACTEVRLSSARSTI